MTTPIISTDYLNRDPDIPRRAQLWKLTPAERAIYDAMQAVEAAGCHPLLTDAVVLLGQAKDKVADYVDGKFEGQPSSLPMDALAERAVYEAEARGIEDD